MKALQAYIVVLILLFSATQIALAQTKSVPENELVMKSAAQVLMERQPKLAAGEAPKKQLVISLQDAVQLVANNNSELKTLYIEQLIEKSRVLEAGAKFDPSLFAGANYGNSEVVFPQIFPTGNFLPNGEPEFFQTIVNDATVVADWNTGVRGLLPTGATWELRHNTNYRDREAGGLVNPSFSSSSSVTVTQPLLRDAWEHYNVADIRRAEFGQKQSRHRFRQNVIAKVLAVHDAYWRYVMAIQDLDVKKRSLALAKDLLEINKVKVKTGSFASVEIVSAESGVASRETEVIEADAGILDAEDILKRLILPFSNVRNWAVVIVPKDPVTLSYSGFPVLDECLDLALVERPDLAELRVALRTEALELALADEESDPKLDLTARYEFTGLADEYGDALSNSFGDSSAQTWSLGFSLEVPLGNRAAKARVSRRRLLRDQALLRYRDAQLSAVAEIRRTHRRVNVTKRAILARRQAYKLKALELKNEQVKLENRRSTNFQVLQTLEDLAQQASLLIRSLGEHHIAVAELAKAMGSSIDTLKWVPGR